MEKRKLSKEQITHVEQFLDAMWENSGYFGHEDFTNYDKAHGYDNIYHLTNHLAKVVVMITPPNPTESSKEKFGFTEKGFAIIQLGSYRAWCISDWWKRKSNAWSLPLNFLNTTILLAIAIAVFSIEKCNSNGSVGKCLKKCNPEAQK